jgi:hypothetical protein
LATAVSILLAAAHELSGQRCHHRPRLSGAATALVLKRKRPDTRVRVLIIAGLGASINAPRGIVLTIRRDIS